MPPARRAAARSSSARPRASTSRNDVRSAARQILTRDPVARRWTAMALRSIAGWSVATIRRKIPGVTAKRMMVWEKTLVDFRDLRMPRRYSERPILPDAELSAVQTALTSGSARSKHQSLRRAMISLSAGGAISKKRESVRKALKRAKWAYQATKKRLPLTPALCVQRLQFTRRETRIIAANTAFSDSKVFEADLTSRGNAGNAWAPEGSPIHRVSKASSAIKVHVYGSITRFAATPLQAATGTSGGLALVDTVPGGRAAIGLNASRGVNAAEYRYLLDDGAGKGMLPATAAIFRRAGVPNWRWQQDGARAHTTGNTATGRPTRALISSYATLVEPWPAHSPDLSPIEKAWAWTERHLHAHESWHDHASFMLAVERSWAAVTTPERCRRLFAGLRSTYSVCIAKGGAEVTGWGAHAK